MGLTAIDPNGGDVDKLIDTLKEALAELRNRKHLL